MRASARALSGIAFLASVVLAASSPPTEEEIAACVRSLGATDLATREEAFARILAWGAEDQERIARLLPSSHEDTEIRDRCRELRNRMLWKPRWRNVAARAGRHADLAGAARKLFPVPARHDDDKVRFDKEMDGFNASLAEFMGKVGTRQKEGSDMLMALLSEEREPLVQGAILVRLGKLGQKEIAPRLIRYLSSSEPQVRFQAADAIGALRNPGVAIQLGFLLQSKDPGIRQAVTRALEMLQDETADLEFRRLLEDADEDGPLEQLAKIGFAPIEGGDSGLPGDPAD